LDKSTNLLDYLLTLLTGVEIMSDLKGLIANNLQYYRKRKKLKQIHVAKILEIDNSTLSKYESGIREPDFVTLERLAALYEVSVGDLIGEMNLKTYAEAEAVKYYEILRNLSKDRRAIIYKLLDTMAEDSKKK
jgi:transcriptional regulator with XRE-family HTH domain